MFKLHYQLSLARTSHCDHYSQTVACNRAERMYFIKYFKAKKREYFVDCLYVQLLSWVWKKL